MSYNTNAKKQQQQQQHSSYLITQRYRETEVQGGQCKYQNE